MSRSRRRGQGKSETGESLTHCALKRFITPSVLKFKKGLLVVVSTKAGQMDTLQAKMSISGRRGQDKSEAGGSLTHCALFFEVQKRGYLQSCFNTS